MSIDIMRSSFGVDEDDNLVVETVVFDAKIAEKEAVVHLQLVRFLRGRQVSGLAALELFNFAAVGGGANMFLGFSVLGDAGFLVQRLLGREFFVLILGVDHLSILAWSGASDKFRGRGTGPFDENDREDAARIRLDDFFFSYSEFGVGCLVVFDFTTYADEDVFIVDADGIISGVGEDAANPRE